MKNKAPDFYNSDKDTTRVRKHAERFSYWISFTYLIFMFFLSRLMEIPLAASMFYPGVMVVGTFIYCNKKFSPRMYPYWFSFSSAMLCILYVNYTGAVTTSLMIYIASLIITAMFRYEKLIVVDMCLGLALSVVCFFKTFEDKPFIENIPDYIEFVVIPIGIYSAHAALVSLVKRDKQLFLFSQQKNRNNLTLLQVVETKKAEAETAAKAKTEFLANTSHEIRTPMNSIMGMTELALREDVSPQVRNYLCNIRDAGTNLLNIINDILDFSKIESGKTELSLTDYNILSIMNDVFNIVTIRMNNDAVQLITCIDPDIPAVLTGDERRIKQIILNLATNAVKYTRHGSITISVSAKKTDDDNVILKCEVKDTGIGIKEHDIKRLFSAFERADTRRNRNIEGTGLGLAICKTLAEMMGGDIKVRSIYGSGSVFSVEIPQSVRDHTPCIRFDNPDDCNILLCINDAEQLNAVSAELSSLRLNFKAIHSVLDIDKDDFSYYSSILIDYEEYNRSRYFLSACGIPVSVIVNPGTKLPPEDSAIRKIYRPVTVISLLSLFGSEDIIGNNDKSASLRQFSAPDARILVVDDNTTNLLVAKSLISLYGVEIDTAESGIQALKMVQKTDYDIVFMDHMMPELDGIETTQAIRSLGGKYSRMTIIALTANVVSGAAELFRESGMDGFLGKPIEMGELNRILLKYIPEEKITYPDSKTEETEQSPEDDFITKLKEIDGLDIPVALRQCNNNTELLADILHSAATTTAVKLLEESFEKKDVRSYTIYIHGMKGALRNVGMESLASIAFDLEMAGKQNDSEYILAHHGEFMERFNVFSDTALRIIDKKPAPPASKGDLSELKNLLAELITAADDMDYNEAKRVTEIIETKTYTESLDEKIPNLCKAVDNFDFEEAVEIAREMEGEI